MSCVNPDRIVEESAGAAKLRNEHERFCAEVAEGLHALAQPLTILRSAISMLAMAGDNAGDCSRYTDMSARQIERACRLFSSLQELIASRTTSAKPERIDIVNLMRRIVEGGSNALAALGIGLAVALPESPVTVLGDPHRTEQALSAAFETAVSVSAAGDVVKLDAFTSEGFLEFRFQSTSKLDNNLKSSDRLNLSVAKANILSQQGRYEFTPEPLRISLALPVYAADTAEITDSETTCCTACID